MSHLNLATTGKYFTAKERAKLVIAIHIKGLLEEPKFESETDKSAYFAKIQTEMD